MNILIISEWGGGLSLGWRMKHEGHKVKMSIHDPKWRNVGTGMIDILDDYNSSLNWADLVICDDGNMGKIAEELRKKGHLVWGGTEFTDKWESDRRLGQDILKQAGMDILPNETFKSVEEAIAFVKSHPSRYVVKPDGKIQDEKALTYVGKDENGTDLIAVLEHYKRYGSKIASFQIQKFVKGIEVACSGFFNGKDFIEPIEVSFEHKKFMDGDIGPATGEMGTSMIWSDKQTRLYRESIERIVPYLVEEGYIGYCDINCIATPEHLYPLEFTTRFGYPTIQLKMETISGDIGELFYEISSGVDHKFPVKSKSSICVVLATPPFPFKSPEVYKKQSEDTLVIFAEGTLPDPSKGIWPLGVRQENNKWLLAGADGGDLIVCGSGDTIDTSRSEAYSRVSSIILPNVMYRTDIGSKTNSQLKDLKDWGWII